MPGNSGWRAVGIAMEVPARLPKRPARGCMPRMREPVLAKRTGTPGMGALPSLCRLLAAGPLVQDPAAFDVVPRFARGDQPAAAFPVVGVEERGQDRAGPRVLMPVLESATVFTFESVEDVRGGGCRDRDRDLRVGFHRLLLYAN